MISVLQHPEGEVQGYWVSASASGIMNLLLFTRSDVPVPDAGFAPAVEYLGGGGGGFPSLKKVWRGFTIQSEIDKTKPNLILLHFLALVLTYKFSVVSS